MDAVEDYEVVDIRLGDIAIYLDRRPHAASETTQP
jgi:hypothetical protein